MRDLGLVCLLGRTEPDPDHPVFLDHGITADAGFRRVFVTLLDTHIAALISAAFLFQFGSSPIRGFAVTLSVGLVTNLFTSTVVSRTLFELALARRPLDRAAVISRRATRP